jgi:hypothetical protein
VGAVHNSVTSLALSWMGAAGALVASAELGWLRMPLLVGIGMPWTAYRRINNDLVPLPVRALCSVGVLPCYT